MLRARSVAVACLAAGALLLSACTTTGTQGDGSSGSAANGAAEGAYPVTIEHSFGSTTIEEEPTRVATLGWTDADVALSLGVVPVGATKIDWGGNENGSTPWFDAELSEVGGKQPTRYSDADGVPVDEVAALAPDVILATNTSMTEQEYQRLSRIAPVVAYPGEAWSTTWEDSLELVGQALGRTDEAGEVREETEKVIEETAQAHPELKDKTFVFASLSTADRSKLDVYSPADNRVRLLNDLGLKNAPFVEQTAKPGEFFFTVSAEQAPQLSSDLLIAYTMEAGQIESFRTDPLIGRIPAFRGGGVVEAADQTAVLGLSAPSPLSIPHTMNAFVPQVAAAAEKS